MMTELDTMSALSDVEAGDTSDHVDEDEREMLSFEDDEIGQLNNTIDWALEESIIKEVEGLLDNVEKTDLANNLKTDFRRRMQKAVAKLTKISEKQSEKAVKQREKKQNKLKKLTLSILSEDSPTPPNDNNTAPSSSAGATPAIAAPGEDLANMAMDDDAMHQAAKGDPNMMNLFLQKRISNLRKELEMTEQKARAVTLQWTTGKEKYKEILEHNRLEKEEMMIKLGILERKVRYLEQKERDPNMIRTNDEANELKQVKQSLEHAEAELAERKATLSTMAVELSDTKMELNTSLSRIDVMSKRIEDLVRSEDQLGDKIETMEKEGKEFQNRIRSMEGDAKDMDRVLEVEKQNYLELKKHQMKQEEMYEDKLAVQKSKIDEMKTMISKLYEEKEAVAKEMQGKIDAVVKENQKLILEKEHEVRSQKILVVGLQTLARTSNRIMQQMEDQEKRVDKKFKSTDEEMMKLRDEVKHLAGSISDVLVESERKVKESEEKLEEQKQMFAKSAEKIQLLEDTIALVRQEMHQKEEAAKEAAHRVEQEFNKVKDNLMKDVSFFKELNAQLEEDLAIERSGPPRYTDEQIQAIRDEEKAIWVAQLEIKEQERQAVASQLTETKSELNGMIEDKRLQDERAVEQQEKLDALTQEVVEANQIMVEMQSEIRQLQEQAVAAALTATSNKAKMSRAPSMKKKVSVKDVSAEEEEEAVDGSIAEDGAENAPSGKLSRQISMKTTANVVGTLSRQASKLSKQPSMRNPVPPDMVDDGVGDEQAVPEHDGVVVKMKMSRGKSMKMNLPSNDEEDEEEDVETPVSKKKVRIQEQEEGEFDDDSEEEEIPVRKVMKSQKSIRKLVDEEEDEEDGDKFEEEDSSAGGVEQDSEEAHPAAEEERGEYGDGQDMDDASYLEDEVSGNNASTQTEPVDDNEAVSVLGMNKVEDIVRQSIQTNNYYFSKEANAFSNAYPIEEGFLRELIRSFYEIGSNAVRLVNKAKADTFGIEQDVETFLLDAAKDLIIKMEKSKEESFAKLKAEHVEQVAEKVEETMQMMAAEKSAALYEQGETFREEIGRLKDKQEDQMKQAVTKIKKMREEHEKAMDVMRKKLKAAASDSEGEGEDDKTEAAAAMASMASPALDPVPPSGKSTPLDGKRIKMSSRQKVNREEIRKELEVEIRAQVTRELEDKRAANDAMLSAAMDNDSIDAQLKELWGQLPERFKNMDLQGMREELLNGELMNIGEVRMENFDRLKTRKFGTDDIVSLTVIEHTMRYDTGDGNTNPFDISSTVEQTPEQIAAQQRQYKMQMKSMEIQKNLLLQRIVSHSNILDFYTYLHNTEKHLKLLGSLNAWRSVLYYQAGGIFRDVLQVHFEVLEMCIKAAGGVTAATDKLATMDASMPTQQWPEFFRVRALEVFRHQLLQEHKEMKRSMDNVLKMMQQKNVNHFIDSRSTVQDSLEKSELVASAATIGQSSAERRNILMQQLNAQMTQRQQTPVVNKPTVNTNVPPKSPQNHSPTNRGGGGEAINDSGSVSSVSTVSVAASNNRSSNSKLLARQPSIMPKYPIMTRTASNVDPEPAENAVVVRKKMDPNEVTTNLTKIANETTFDHPHSRAVDINHIIKNMPKEHIAVGHKLYQITGGLHYKVDYIAFEALRGDSQSYDLLTTYHQAFAEWEGYHNIQANNLFQSCVGRVEDSVIEDVTLTFIKASVHSEMSTEMKEVYEKICNVLDICDVIKSRNESVPPLPILEAMQAEGKYSKSPTASGKGSAAASFMLSKQLSMSFDTRGKLGRSFSLNPAALLGSGALKPATTTFDCGTQTQFDFVPVLKGKAASSRNGFSNPHSNVGSKPTSANIGVLRSTHSIAEVDEDDKSHDASIADGNMSLVNIVPPVEGAAADFVDLAGDVPALESNLREIELLKKKLEDEEAAKKAKHSFGLPPGFMFALFKDDEFEVSEGVFICSYERLETTLRNQYAENVYHREMRLQRLKEDEEKLAAEPESYEKLMKKKAKKTEKVEPEEKIEDITLWLARIDQLPANVRYCHGPNIHLDDQLHGGLQAAPMFLELPVISHFRPFIFPPVYPLRPGMNLISGFQCLGQGNDHLFSALTQFKGKNNTQEVLALPKDLLLLQIISEYADNGGGGMALPRGMYRATLSPKIIRDPQVFSQRKDIPGYSHEGTGKKKKSRKFISGKPVELEEMLDNLEIPLGHELVQVVGCLIDFPVGVEVSPGVKIAATPANIVLPDHIRLVKKSRKTPLPAFMHSLSEATDDESINIGVKMNECITVVQKPADIIYEIGMEVIRRPPGHPLPPGITPVPLKLYPEGLELDEHLELVQLTPKFDFPPECRLTSAWYVLPRPHKVSLKPNQYIVYPDVSLEDHAVPPLPVYACPIPMPYLPYGVILPARAQAVELLLSKLTQFALPEGAMLAPGITVLHPKIFKDNMRNVAEGHERTSPAVNVLLVKRAPGTPLPPTVERGSRTDLPVGVLLEENMDVVRIAVRFELPPGVKVDMGVQLGPHVQLSPGTRLNSSTISGSRKHVKALTVIEWPYGISLDPGIEMVSKPPKGTYLPFEYLRVNPASDIDLPDDVILVKLPRDLQLSSSLQIAERITVGIESVMEEYHRPLPEGMIFASRQSSSVQWPGGMSSVPRSALPVKLMQVVDRINSDTVEDNKGNAAAEGQKKSNVNVEIVQLSAVFELPAGVELISGVVTVEKPFWLQKHSKIAVLKLQDYEQDIKRLVEKEIFEVRFRSDEQAMNMRPKDVRSGAAEDIYAKYPLPENCIIAKLPDVFEVYSWKDCLPGVESVTWDSSTQNLALPPWHFLIQRPRHKKDDELPQGFQMGICEHYRMLRIPSLPPMLELMHIVPTRHLPLGVNIINTSILSRNQFNSMTGGTVMSGTGGTYSLKSFQPFWIPQLSPMETVSNQAVVLPWPSYTNTILPELLEIDPNLFREPHALVWFKDPKAAETAYPGNLKKHSSSYYIVSKLFPVKKDGVIDPFLTSNSEDDSVLPIQITDVVHVVCVSNGFPNPRDRFKIPTATSKGSLDPINADDESIVVHPRLNRVQRLQLLDPVAEVNNFLSQIHVFRFGKEAKEMEMELKHLRFDIMESALFKSLSGADKLSAEVDKLKVHLRKAQAANNNLQAALDLVHDEFKTMKDQLQDQEDLKAIIGILRDKLQQKASEISGIKDARNDQALRLQTQMDVLTTQIAKYKEDEFKERAEVEQQQKQEEEKASKEIAIPGGRLPLAFFERIKKATHEQILTLTQLFTAAINMHVKELEQHVFDPCISTFSIAAIIDDGERSVGSEPFPMANLSPPKPHSPPRQSCHHPTDISTINDDELSTFSEGDLARPSIDNSSVFSSNVSLEGSLRSATDLTRLPNGKKLVVTESFPLNVKSLYKTDHQEDDVQSYMSFAKSISKPPPSSANSVFSADHMSLATSKSHDSLMLSRTISDLLSRRRKAAPHQSQSSKQSSNRLPKLTPGLGGQSVSAKYDSGAMPLNSNASSTGHHHSVAGGSNQAEHVHQAVSYYQSRFHIEKGQEALKQELLRSIHDLEASIFTINATIQESLHAVTTNEYAVLLAHESNIESFDDDVTTHSTVDHVNWPQLQQVLHVMFTKLFGLCAEVMQAQRDNYMQNLHQLEHENQYLTRELKATRGNVTLLQDMLQEHHRNEGTAKEILQQEELKKKILNLENKFERLLEGQVEGEMMTMQGHIEKLVHLNALEKQLKFTNFTIRQKVAKEESKLPKDHIHHHHYPASKQKAVDYDLSDNEVKAIRHHCTRLKAVAKQNDDRMKNIQQESTQTIAMVLEHIEAYQRSIQDILPPKLLMMMLQRSMQYYEKLKLSSNRNDFGGVSSGDSVVSSLVDFPATDSQQLDADDSLSLHTTNTAPSSILPPKKLPGSSSASVASNTAPSISFNPASSIGERILRDSAATLIQPKVKFGSIGSMPPSNSSSQFSKRVEGSSAKRKL